MSASKGERVRITVRMPTKLWQELNYDAMLKMSTVNDEIVRIIAEAKGYQQKVKRP